MISTHSAREDGDDSDHITIHGVEISTHSAREDGDFGWGGTSVISEDFNPLRPRGRRPVPNPSAMHPRLFQPTPPARTETYSDGGQVDELIYFNPLRPRGRRQP